MSKKRANGKLFWNISWKAEQSYKSQLIRDPIHPHITLLSLDHLYFQSQLNPCILHQYLYYKFPPLIFLFFYYNFLYYKTHMIIILFLKQNVFFMYWNTFIHDLFDSVFLKGRERNCFAFIIINWILHPSKPRFRGQILGRNIKFWEINIVVIWIPL